MDYARRVVVIIEYGPNWPESGSGPPTVIPVCATLLPVIYDSPSIMGVVYPSRYFGYSGSRVGRWARFHCSLFCSAIGKER
jgi:hypothetical protein